MWQTNLIKLYCAICDNSSTIEAVTQCQSNNFRPQFSDEECITVYLRGIRQRKFEKKTIYEYTKNHLLEWYPKMPNNQAFSDRLNKSVPAFQVLAEHWLSVIGVNLHEYMEYIVDPPYSPEYNPDEYLNNDLKRSLGTQTMVKNVQELEANTSEFMDGLSADPDHVKAYFDHSALKNYKLQ